MMNKTKTNELIREQIISRNNKTIRKSIDNISFITNNKLKAEYNGLAKAKNTKSFYIVQSHLNDTFSDVSSCTYQPPNIDTPCRVGIQQVACGESGSGKGTLSKHRSESKRRTQARNEEFVSNNDLAWSISDKYDSRQYYFENINNWNQKDEINMNYNPDAFVKYWRSTDITNKFEIRGSNKQSLMESMISHNCSGTIESYELSSQISNMNRSGKKNSIILLCELADDSIKGMPARKVNGKNIPDIIGNNVNFFSYSTMQDYAEFLAAGSAQGLGGRICAAFNFKRYNDPLADSQWNFPIFVPSIELIVSRRHQLWRHTHFERNNAGEWGVKSHLPNWIYPNNKPTDDIECISVFAGNYMRTNNCSFEKVVYPNTWNNQDIGQIKLKYYTPYCYYIKTEYLTNFGINQNYKSIVNRKFQRLCNASLSFGFQMDQMSIRDPRHSILWSESPFSKESCDLAWKFGEICDRQSFQILKCYNNFYTNDMNKNKENLNKSWSFVQPDNFEYTLRQ
eukprot:453712_1